MRVLVPRGGNVPGFTSVEASLPRTGRAVVDFGAGSFDARTQVAAPDIASSSVVFAQLAAIDTPDHSADEHWLEEDLAVFAGAPAAGVGFPIIARAGRHALRGRYAVAWSWS